MISFKRPTVVALSTLGIALLAAQDASSQGCVTARMDSPVPGVDSHLGAGKKWEMSMSWRHFKSDRHFIGADEQEERTSEGSQVINRANTADIAVRYNFSNRNSLSLSVPYIMNERSSPLRDANRVVVARSEVHASGIGDTILMARRWMLDPAVHTRSNFRLGAGIKLPTGESSAQDAARVLNPDGTFSQVVRPVDQSIQPGDGAFGFVIDGQAFKALGHGGVSLYGSGGYLFNPRETSFLQSNATTYWSVPDQYVARWGVSIDPPSRSWGVALGGRIDGVPAEDVFGSSEGRRRPGYSVDIDPSLRYSVGAVSFNVAVPVAVYRNRTRSVPDKASGGHGDAAFADYNVIVGVSRQF